MGRDISISITAQDNFTAAITKMKTATAQFRAESTDLGKRLEELNKTKATLTVDATKAQAELKAAKKGLDDTQESADRLAKAQISYDNLRAELNLVSSQAKETEKAITSMSGAITTSKELAAEAGGGSGSGSNTGSSGTGITASNFTWSTVANSELAKNITGTVQKAASYYVESLTGSETANEISSTLSGAVSGALSGAAIGSMIAPGIGSVVGGAIGTAVGGLTSYLSAKVDEAENRDEYFKSSYQDFYNDLTSQYETSLDNGKSVAASREQTQLAFSTLLGSDEAASDWTQWMQEFAAVTPFAFEDLTAMSKTAISYKFDTESTKELMQAIGDAGSALGLAGSDLTNVATYIGRMNSTDKVSLEYLNPLIERGIPAIDYIAAAMEEQTGEEWSTQDVYDAVSKGTLDGSDMVVEILERMEESFSGSMEKQSQTYEGLTSTLEDTMTELDAAMGSGYNEARKESLQAQIDFYGGDSGDMMSEAYNLIGQWQASMDNLQDQLKMDALAEVMDGDAFKEAVASGTNEGAAEAGRMLAEALAQAEAEYTNTEGYDLMIQSQTEVIEGVRDELSDSNYEAGYELGLEFTKGIAAAMTSEESVANVEVAASYINGIATQGMNVPRNATSASQAAAGGKTITTTNQTEIPRNGHAFGLEYVPYNDYPANLHEGERVMTAEENREYSSGGLGNVMITGNSFTVREDADIEKIGQEIYKQLLKAHRMRA